VTPAAGAAPPVATIAAARGLVTGFAAVTGLIVGSFLNVVVYRVPRGLSVVRPRSFCPSCRTPVRPVDNVPIVSWVMLRGRCHQCRSAISVRYPLVEAATGATFAALAWSLGPHWGVAGFCVIAATLTALIAVERDGLVPPLSVAVTGTAVATVLLVAAGSVDRRWNHVAGVVIGAAAGAALLAATAWHGSRRPRPRRLPQVSGLLPAGAALGWLGPTYAGAGVGVAAVALIAAGIGRHHRALTANDSGGDRWFEVSLGIGVAVAVALSVAFGAAPGR
jgi:leader peptidase (prepilin peptidase) / N-methyltransferase